VSTSSVDISVNVDPASGRPTPAPSSLWPVMLRRGAVSTWMNVQGGEAVIGVLLERSAGTRLLLTTVSVTTTTTAVINSLVCTA